MQFVQTSEAPAAGHAVGVTSEGEAITWATAKRGNRFGQLGRADPDRKPAPVKEMPHPIVAAFAGGSKSSGHTALLDATGALWLCGCDRWQQLGLGSSAAGSTGYTWSDGKIWQNTFQRCWALDELIVDDSTIRTPGSNPRASKRNQIRDVALGGDHTVVLATNRLDVYSFGRGQFGQLGVNGMPFVSAPVRADALCSDDTRTPIAAVCAFGDCTVTLSDAGIVMRKAGKCARTFLEAVEECRVGAQRRGLIR